MITIPIYEYITKLLQPRSLISLFALVLLAAILFIISRRTALNARMLAYGALAIAASFALSYIRIFQLPNGGTITLASMLPIFIYAFIAGPQAAITAGLCYGLLQFIQEPFFVHWAQFLLDYPIAYAFLGLAGIAKDRFFTGVVIGSFARFISHFLSGFIFFANYAPEGQNPVIYSFLYNLSYMLPDMLICIGILLIPNVRAAIRRIDRSAGQLQSRHS